MTKTRSLGKTQIAILTSLHAHKRWSDGCGWIWSTRGATVRLLEGLVARGLVTKVERTYRHPIFKDDRKYISYEPVKPEVWEA